MEKQAEEASASVARSTMAIHGSIPVSPTMENYEAALERFFIMSAEPDVDDITALKYIKEKYGRVIAVKIWEEWVKK